MKAIIHDGKSGIEGLKYKDVPSKTLAYGEVLVKIKTAGLNHRDLFLMKARTENDPAFILGSDGAGLIEAVGEGVKGLSANTEVIINPTMNWKSADILPEVLDILGGPSDGTFSEYVIIPAENAVKKPAYLSWEEAGVLPLSALTAYRALFTKGKLKKDEHIIIPGIGGGVATFALLMAKAAGAKVSVTSRSEDKRKTALAIGADFAFDSYGDWKKSLNGEKADIVLDSIGPAVFSSYFEILKPNGRIVSFGASSGDTIDIPLRSLFFPQISILGTSMGSSEEFTRMVHFMEQHSLRPIIDQIYPLQEAAAAFSRMKHGGQFGNIGLSVI
ncbi:alcohol dehydrogenase [Bacillus atrophaeus]|uniref:zinc-binding dehydrogenase n=1 Tax=Bacillus atrophaeus TaxID=1452 RepID=UPI000D031D7C|nr:zinc-binding dehydrogenase [Bacillus atrophaeus]PRS03126.1 alcohol dehydrogenase [Bacillus atrophaeus]